MSTLSKALASSHYLAAARYSRGVVPCIVHMCAYDDGGDQRLASFR